MRIQRTVTVDRPLGRVYAYLADFTTTTEWDPGTVRTVRRSGDGGVGTRYLNTSTFAGRRTELVYEVRARDENRRFALRGENRGVVAHDTMEFEELPGSDGRGTRITYTADFRFRGLARLVAPFLVPALRRLGDDAARGMTEALCRL